MIFTLCRYCFFFFFFFFVVACSSYQFPTNQLMVSVSNQLANDPDKSHVLERYRIAEYLDQYMHDWADEYQPRTSLRIETTITGMRFGFGTDYMTVDTIVTENGEIIASFDNRRHTTRRSPVKRITHVLAKDIMSEVSRL